MGEGLIDLDQWQARLGQHFERLQLVRRQAGCDRPIFALEHGLEKTETEALDAAIRNHIAILKPSRKHGLPWIVYAAELGYGYSGDEYWPTFEERTPGWTDRGDRYWLRERFREFHRQFGGARPSGSWAEQFSIICWPITHAILPRDLQRHFARVLYELRGLFTAELFDSPLELGRFIAERSWYASSRFQNFVQEHALVGQIAAALLHPEQRSAGTLVLSTTLQRIGKDLDRQREAREWLRVARQFAQESVHVRGLAIGRLTDSSAIARPEDARNEIRALGIEPRLILRPATASGAAWDLYLEVPDLSCLCVQFPATRDTLIGSRCVVGGTEGRPQARGLFLNRRNTFKLVRWPNPNEALLQFEQPNDELEFLLRTECLLRPGGARLFRVASDRCAYEVQSLRVRPGECYVLLDTSESIPLGPHALPVTVHCEGVCGVALDLPESITEDWERTLRVLNLRQARAIEVWPAGLDAVTWDGEGHGKWPVSERACLAIRADHAVDSILVTMVGAMSPPLEVAAVLPGETVFLELPTLPAGTHTIHVLARSGGLKEAEPLGQLDVVVGVARTMQSSWGVRPQGPLLLQLFPQVPTLEEIWEGRAELSLRGPAGRTARCCVSLFDSDGNRATIEKRLPAITLPVSADQWNGHFQKHFRRSKDVQNAYDTARICELRLTAEELGAFTVRCEREFAPLRWVLRQRREGTQLHLLDDSGASDKPSVVRISYKTPLLEEQIEGYSPYVAPASGGMYVARSSGNTAAILVPPVVKEFSDLKCAPRIDRQERSREAVLRVLSLARLWAQGRVPGIENLFCEGRRHEVVRALTRELCCLFGGQKWAAAERDHEENGVGIGALRQAIAGRSDHAAIGGELLARGPEYSKMAVEERVWLFLKLCRKFELLPPAPPQEFKRESTVVRRYASKDADPRWLVGLALRLASDPTCVENWAGESLGAGVVRLLVDLPTLVRAARFSVLVVEEEGASPHAPDQEWYVGWRWT